MRKILIAGNWKMNTDVNSSKELVTSINKFIEGSNLKTEILVCPPFTSLNTIREIVEESNIKLGAQNCEYRDSGAYTGEISVSMLKSVNCNYVIVGHSERRSYYGETDSLVNLKAKAAFNGGLIPIICIGETLEERNTGNTFSVLELQIKFALEGFDNNDIEKLVIAYEPVWAIGTGISATNEQADEAHTWIREYVKSNYGSNAGEIRVLYGGSMNDKNAKELLSLENVDGGLIGGASLKPEAFVAIINAAESTLN